MCTRRQASTCVYIQTEDSQKLSTRCLKTVREIVEGSCGRVGGGGGGGGGGGVPPGSLTRLAGGHEHID